MKPNKLLAPAILQPASAVNAKGLGLETHKQYIKYFWEAHIYFVWVVFFWHVRHQLFTYIAKHDYYGLSK